MADITPQVVAGAPVIQSYSPEGFTIGGKGYKGAVLIVGGMVETLQLEAISALTEAQLDASKTHEISYLILGCGVLSQMPSRAITEALKRRGIVVESMTTPAACRTHNVLLAEERRFGTLLLPA